MESHGVPQMGGRGSRRVGLALIGVYAALGFGDLRSLHAGARLGPHADHERDDPGQGHGRIASCSPSSRGSVRTRPGSKPIGPRSIE